MIVMPDMVDWRRVVVERLMEGAKATSEASLGTSIASGDGERNEE